MLEFLNIKEKPNETLIKYRFDKGPKAGSEFYGRMLICSAPTCCCNMVHLHLVSAETKEALSIALDVENRTFHKDSDDGAANQNIAESMAAELTDGEWNKLRSAYILHKENATEESDLSDVKPDFPKHLDGNKVYDVREVLPHAAPFRFWDDKGEIQALDAYCCVPHCACKDSFLGFVRPSTSRSVKENLTEICVSYFSKKIEEVIHISADTSLPPPEELIVMLERDYPDIWVRLRKNHERMKRLYHRFISDTSSRSFKRPSSKIGRNDLCSCGSGKKFKKCCMAR